MPNTLQEWIAYIEGLHRKTIELGLDRVGMVADRLEVRSFKCPVITVAGTNGKGSCVAFLENILHAAGYRIGTYTSPHLMRFNERIRIGGHEVSDDNLVHAFAQVERVRADTPLTYFEFVTLAALVLFQASELDVLILEVGMGGRLDAVNIVEADVAVVTTIALDHMEWLGDNREAIGAEKAGIFRPRKLAVCGDSTTPSSILEIANKIQTSLHCLNKDFYFRPQQNSWEWHSAKTKYMDLPLPKLPLQNAATALMVIECLASRLKVDRGAIECGLKLAFMPGRFQCFNQPVTTILDVAHNPAATLLLAERLTDQAHSGRTLAVVSILADKDIKGSLFPLVRCVQEWYVAGLKVPRGETAEMMGAHLQSLGVNAYHKASSVLAAYLEAVHAFRTGDRIVVFGSFYTVAEVCSYLTAYNHAAF